MQLGCGLHDFGQSGQRLGRYTHKFGFGTFENNNCWAVV